MQEAGRGEAACRRQRACGRVEEGHQTERGIVGHIELTGCELSDAQGWSVELDLGFPPSKFDLAAHVAGKKVILMGLPGAFTPT